MPEPTSAARDTDPANSLYKIEQMRRRLLPKETARMTDDTRTTGGKFARPKSLYIEATGIKDDGTEFVVKMRLEPATTDDSFLTLDMENLFVDDDSNGLYIKQSPTGEYNVTIEFTRCRLGDPDA